MKTFTCFLAALLLSGTAQAQEGPAAADVMLLTGAATAESGGLVRSLSKGSPVHSGDQITVGANSYLNLLFRDGGRVLLRPGTQFAVESFEYTPPAAEPAAAPAPDPAAPPLVTAGAAAPASGKAFFRLVKGGFRAISGLLGKVNRSEYQVTTPIATIGIRGTDFDTLLCEADCPTEMLPPGTPPGEGGLVVGVNEGGIGVTTPQGTFNVDVNQFGYALSNGQFFVLPFQPMNLMLNPSPDPTTCQ